MKSKRLVSLLLALLLTAPAMLTACGEKEEETKGTYTPSIIESDTEIETEEETFPPDAVDELPADLTFDGEEFVMHTWGGWACLVKDQTGDALNDAKYDMDLKTEERLGVTIIDEHSDFDLRTAISSGDTYIDVANQLDRDGVTNALQNYFYPLDKVNYIDVSKKYWNGHVSEKLAIGNSNFFALSSFQLNSFKNAGCVFMNLAVADDYNIEAPQEDVENGTWTLDKLAAYGTVANRDIDNDSVYTSVDAVTFGGLSGMQIASNLVVGAGMTIMEKDENNLPYYTIFGNEAFVDLINFIRSNFVNPQTTINVEENGWTLLPVFLDDRMLFGFGVIDNILSLREMESEYTILPMPKLNELQESYHSRSFDNMFSMVLTNVTNPDMCGAVMEAMSAYAYQYVVPAYVKTSLQEKYARNQAMFDNIQIVFDTRNVELGEMLNFSKFGDTPFSRTVMDTSTEFATWLASNKKWCEKNLANTIKKLEKLASES